MNKVCVSLYRVLDNASNYKAVSDYVESAGGDVELEFLSPSPRS